MNTSSIVSNRFFPVLLSVMGATAVSIGLGATTALAQAPNPGVVAKATPNEQSNTALYLSLATALGTGIGAGAVHALRRPDKTKVSSKSSIPHYTIERYNLLQIGMSRHDVEVILVGPGDEESRSQDGVRIKWANADGSYIRALFQQDKLTTLEKDRLPRSAT